MKKFFIFYFLFFSLCLQAQDSIKTVDEISMEDDLGLEELMNVKLTVASQKELTIDQTPAIVSIITKDEIEQSAAKDITDILRLIPGFEFAADVNSEIGLGVRGAWGAEGKVLVMLDGLQINENMYGTTQWIGRFDISQIEKIEIIRGPGYAAYNGLASLGVINIITKKAKDIQGIQTNAFYSRLSNSYGRQLVSLTAGWQKENWGIKGSVYTGKLNRSEGLFKDLDSHTVIMNEGNWNKVTPTQISIAANYKKLELNYLHDNYYSTAPFHIAYVLAKPGMTNYTTRQFNAKYTWNVTKKWALLPQFNVNFNRPYTSNSVADTSDPNYYLFDHHVTRFTTSIASRYIVNSFLQINAGVGFFQDQFGVNTSNSIYALSDGLTKTTYNDVFDYVEFFIQKNNFNISIGGRHEKHSVYESVFLPRLAVTKQLKKFNFKAAYSHAFRAPLVENIIANSEIKPEITRVGEFQISYKPTNNWYLSFNIFDNHISKIIVYDVVDTLENYFNFNRFGTRGFEFESKFKKDKFMFSLNYAYYFMTVNDVDKYQSIDKHALVALSPHKASISAMYHLSNSWNIATSTVIYGKRSAFIHEGADDLPYQEYLNPTFITNVTLSYACLKSSCLKTQLGVYDIFNSGYSYVQAYNGGKAPFRATGREIGIKLTYNFSKI